MSDEHNKPKDKNENNDKFEREIFMHHYNSKSNSNICLMNIAIAIESLA